MIQRVLETAIPYLMRPSSRMAELDPAQMENKELLSLLIGGPYASSDAEILLEAIGGNLNVLYNLSVEELARNYQSVGYATARRIKAGLELGRRISCSGDVRPMIDSATAAGDYFLRHGLGLCDQEELWVLNLDNRNKVLKLSRVYKGNVNSSIVRICEVLRDAVRLNATALIMGHNHPSGEPTPSPEDVQMTRSVSEGAGLMGLSFLDHIIVGRNNWISLKERGLGGLGLFP